MTDRIQTGMPQYRSEMLIRESELNRYFVGGLVAKLKDRYLPEFMKGAGISDFRSNGFRLVADVPENNPVLFGKDGRTARIILFSGNYTPNLCPQDWRTPKPVVWDPAVSLPFFEGCAAAARENIIQTPSGDRLFLPDISPGCFGLNDADPKGDAHFLIVTIESFATIMDEGFSYGSLTDLFKLAKLILKEFGQHDKRTRYCINSGFGYQSVARLHMHVMNFTGYVPKILPQCYGFVVDEAGSVKAPEGSQSHKQILDIIERRRDISGFDEAAREGRKALDKEIFFLLRQLPQ